MKAKLLLLTLYIAALVTLISSVQASQLPLPGTQAPAINITATTKEKFFDISPRVYQGKYVILFFYPADFSTVCPTELRALEAEKPAFDKLNTLIFAVSTDPLEVHKKWLSTAPNENGISDISYPLLSDSNHTLARSYGVLDKSGRAHRAAFIISPSNTIQFVYVTTEDVGRDTKELLRQIEALQFSEKNGLMCPANWSGSGKIPGLEKNK